MKILKALWKWFLNIFLALDYLMNAVILGDPNETASSRMGKKAERGTCKLCKILCKFINFVDDRHCENAINWNEGRGSAGDDSVIGWWRRQP